MISEIIKTKNAKTLVYYDTPYTKATAIGCDSFRLATVTSDIITQEGAEFDFFVKPAKIDKNAIKDYGDNKRVLITIDADSVTRPVFIETPDDTAKIMLCTCRNK